MTRNGVFGHECINLDNTNIKSVVVNRNILYDEVKIKTPYSLSFRYSVRPVNVRVKSHY